MKTKQQAKQAKNLQAAKKELKKEKSDLKATLRLTPDAKLSSRDKRRLAASVSKAKRDGRLPKTAQQTIPYQEMCRDGICIIGDRYFTKQIQFYDVNYQLAQNEDKNLIFENYCDFLNYFDSSIKVQLSFLNQRADMEEYQKSIHIPEQADAFNGIRREYSGMLKGQLARGNNGLTKTKYITFGIDHCREGRIEQEAGAGAYSYLEAGDLRVDQRIHHNGKVTFPLCHYHGISIGFQMSVAAKEIPDHMKDFSVDLYELQKKYCSDPKPFVIPGEPAIEHIFSELYNVPLKIKRDYFKIKVLELLLYLDALELSGHTEERPYFYKGQVEKIKAIQALLTEDLTKSYTLEELSEQFDIALTPLKNCFKTVYGSPIFTYMRTYRMNYAATLLKSDKNLKIAEIAGLVGYDSPSKFSSAFHQTMGKTPLEYRKSFV